MVYALSLSALFGVSALYHEVTWSVPVRQRMRRLDHSMIFLLIAGTYTPFGVLVLPGTLALVVLAVVWGGALLGMALNMVWIDAPKWFSAIVYISLGWVAVVAFPELVSQLGDGHRPDRARRRALLGGCRSLRPQTSGPRARGVRLSRGVPCARDRSSGRTLCRRCVLRTPAQLSGIRGEEQRPAVPGAELRFSDVAPPRPGFKMEG